MWRLVTPKPTIHAREVHAIDVEREWRTVPGRYRALADEFPELFAQIEMRRREVEGHNGHT
jgi:hypothetical protein